MDFPKVFLEQSVDVPENFYNKVIVIIIIVDVSEGIPVDEGFSGKSFR